MTKIQQNELTFELAQKCQYNPTGHQSPLTLQTNVSIFTEPAPFLAIYF
uniref:Uncharacterized protein n=1 Tax=Anguilla anguilla TaxID=7936 RepID=A0A0E9S5R3_ANGAN